MEDADERANEVVRVGVDAEIAAGDGAFDQADESGVNETGEPAMRPIEPPATVSIAGMMSLFSGNMVDEEGAEVHRGDLTHLDSLHEVAPGINVVVNLAFSQDFSKFRAECAGRNQGD